MENRQHDRVRFDEQAGLEQLERFRQDIERYRAKRKAANEEFEAFIRSFKNPQPSAGTQPPYPPARRQVRENTPPSAPAPPAPDTPAPPVLNAPSDREYGAAVPRPLAPPPPAHQRARLRTPALIGGAVMLVAAGAWVAWMAQTPAPHTTPTAPLPDTRAPAPRAAPGPAASIVQPTASVTELTTTRPVWVRVVADGQRVVERELPANARVPLRAEKTIVIRTGNAGAVRLTLAGQDQGVLGPEGTVVTRAFTVPRSAPR
jgi:hypothetical protein